MACVKALKTDAYFAIIMVDMDNITTGEVWERFKRFFEKNGHQLLPPASLVPENDASVLFTTAGMHQFKGYYLKPDLAPAARVITNQPAVRTTDIEEVGDETHLTAFEMLGNFSFGYPKKDGSYFKEEAINLAWQLLTKVYGFPKERMHATYFLGDNETPADLESKAILSKVTSLSEEDIRPQGREDNFWGPTGVEGPCGPTVEFYVDNVEIWNLVFNQFYAKKGKFTELEYQGVDTGAGLERVTATLNGKRSVYTIDVIAPLALVIGAADSKPAKIIIDHVRAVAMLIKDGVLPSNKEQGYVLRRLIRRMLKSAEDIKLPPEKFKELFLVLAEVWGDRYPELREKREVIFSQFEKERKKYAEALRSGIKELKKLFLERPNRTWGREAFYLYESFGLPPEMAYEDLIKMGVKLDLEAAKREYRQAERSHQELSRAGIGKFKGGLAGHSPEEVRLHTATHLLLAALRKVLGDHVVQRGSNITPERLRLDFSHPEKVSPEEIAKVQELVNDWIKSGLLVSRQEMSKEKAFSSGAMGVFDQKYGGVVSVYTVGGEKEPVSKEICGGPHVQNSRMIGKLKIVKEEASSAGVRRIKAVLEPADGQFSAV